MRPLIAAALAACLLATVAAAGCVEAPDDQDPALLEDRTWVLVSMRTASGASIEPTAGRVTARFGEGAFGGDGGINSYGGTFRADASGDITLTLGPIDAVAGSPQRVAQQQNYLAQLRQVTRFAVTDDSLELSSGQEEVLLRYEPVVEPSLTGTVWYCTGYEDGLGGLATPQEGSSITVVFGGDGMIAGSAGVNEYSATYAAAEASMTVTDPLVTTRKTGPRRLLDQERAFLGSLPRVTRYAIADGQLVLYGGPDGSSRIAEFTSPPHRNADSRRLGPRGPLDG